MNRTVLLATIALCWFTPAGAAEYCAHYNDGSQSCGIPTFESCLQSVSGVGGECMIDNSSEIPQNLMQRLREAQPLQPAPPEAVQSLQAMPPPPPQ